MNGPSRRLYLYWVLLLLPTLAVGVGAFHLIGREQQRLEEQAGLIEESRRTALRTRARIAAENVELIVSDLQTGLLENLARPASLDTDSFLAGLQRTNPLVHSTFRCSAEGLLLRPSSADLDESARAFHRRFSTSLRSLAPGLFAQSEKAPGLLPFSIDATLPASPGITAPSKEERFPGVVPRLVPSAPSPEKFVREEPALKSVSQTSPVPAAEPVAKGEPALSEELAASDYALNVQRARRDVQALSKVRGEASQRTEAKVPAPPRADKKSVSSLADFDAPAISVSSAHTAPDGGVSSSSAYASRSSRRSSAAPTAPVSVANELGAANRQASAQAASKQGFPPPAQSGAKDADAGAESGLVVPGHERDSEEKAQGPVIDQQRAFVDHAPAEPVKQAGATTAQLEEADTGLRRQAPAAVQSAAPLSQVLPSPSLAAAAQAPGATPERTGGERSGWLPLSVENRLFLLGWHQRERGGEVLGIELEMQALVSRLGAALPTDMTGGEGLCLRDERGRLFHQVGTLPPDEAALPGSVEATRLLRLPINAALLPGWTVEAYLPQLVAPDTRAPGFVLTASLLAGILLVSILAGGSLLLLQARASSREALLKTSFVANVSHELKTPLTTIRLYADLLEQGRVRGEERRAEYLRTIGRESERLTRLVGNVLDFSRLERGTRQLSTEPLDAGVELRSLCAAHGARITEAGLRLDVELPDGAVPVVADRDALGQIFLNLLDNAAKYAAQGGELRVAVARAPGGGALLCLCDRGPGVPAAERERIFEKFHRLDQRLTAEKGGAGLGLSIARQLARGMGGDLRCLPREGGGACFELRLPGPAAERGGA